MSATFHITRRVHFAEVDLAGVLHFSNYFRLMEEVEHAFWRSIGLSVVASGAEHHVSWPRVAVQCEYFAPARFEDALDLHLSLLDIGRRSLKFEVAFCRDDQRLAEGRFTTVCCELTGASFRVIDIPDDIRTVLEKHLASPDAS